MDYGDIIWVWNGIDLPREGTFRKWACGHRCEVMIDGIIEYCEAAHVYTNKPMLVKDVVTISENHKKWLKKVFKDPGCLL
jgi:hypothetical protein